MLGVVVASYREFSSRVKLLTTAGHTKGDRIGEVIKQTVGTITKAEIMKKCPDISQITIQRALIELQEQEKIIKSVVGVTPNIHGTGKRRIRK